MLDNTEETTPFWTPRTLHAISATLETGFRVDDNLGGAHSIVFGGYGAQFMGATRGFNAGGGIFAYYNYTYTNEFNAYFGIFPRSAWIAKYPRSFFSEDYLFLHPEINGAMLQYSGESGVIKGYAEATLEHFGADLKNATDEFYALFGGEIKIWDLLFLGANGTLYHHQDDRILSKDNQNTYLMDRVLYGAHLWIAENLLYMQSL